MNAGHLQPLGSNDAAARPDSNVLSDRRTRMPSPTCLRVMRLAQIGQASKQDALELTIGLLLLRNSPRTRAPLQG